MGKSLQGGRLVSNSRIFVDSGGNIGIGSTQPTSKFDIAGDVKITGISTLSNVTIGGATTELIVEGDARVTGISTLSNVTVGGATTELVVNGDARVTGILTVGTASLTLNGTTGAITGGSLTNAQVAAISSEISESDVVDVFVYDTSKDSDGGAWRKRTQHTSWYNETLNTSTRGSRREFPSVAVIVTTSDNANDSAAEVRIYDGDDPDLPMWMVFKASGGVGSNASRFAIPGINGLKASVMLNGILSVAVNDTVAGRAGLEIINFLSETTEHLSSSLANGNVRSEDSIAKRNTAISNSPTDDIRQIVNNAANDVAMTVLPNAPIDETTGLPVPTVALATDGGISVITDNGNVFDGVDGSSYGSLDFTFHDGIRLVSTRSTTGSQSQRYFISQQIHTISADGWSPYDYYTGNFDGGYPRLLDNDNGAGFVSRNDNNGTVLGSNVGLSLWYVKSSDKLVNDYTTSSLLCGISTTYNTGWMHGDIKGAFLSDTDATNISYSNLIDNGDFGTGDFTNWSVNGTTTPTISSGGALLTTGAIDGAIWQSTSGEATSGKWVITWTVTSNSGGYFGLFLNNDGPNGSGGSLVQDNITTSGSYYYEGNISAVEFRHRLSSSGIIDNITLRRVGDEDRSVNNKGLQVFGTVTKSAVATGAELVAYSGFSASTNYLSQPYNADMNFGTGDFCVMGWINVSSLPGSGSLVLVAQHNGVDNGGNRWSFYILNSGILGFYQDDGPSSTNTTNGPEIKTGVWQHVAVVRRGSANQVVFYVNGERLARTDTTRDVDNTGNITTVGVDHTFGSAAVNTSISLLRISKSEPSEEQIKKIYEDEKMLFQENAACTLYGSSDAVTALAYDDSNDLLHVGTSSGRSDFQGLRRINNTTTAVTTAMSASNGLVAEQ